MTCEVWNLFAHLIPGEALSRIEAGRKRQALVPDFRVEVPKVGGRGAEYRLAELKVLSCCPTWYGAPNASVTVRAVEKRANGLQADYVNKAKKVDKSMNGFIEGVKGPVEKRLNEFGEVIGLCFGAWGEANEDVHTLIDTLANARLQFQGMQRGRPGSKQELGVIVGQIRRRISVTVMRAQTSCLLSRLHQVGPGNKTLAKRREWAMLEDDRMRQERKAQWIRKFEGIRTLQKGQIKAQ